MPVSSAGRNRRPGLAGAARYAATVDAASTAASPSRTSRVRRAAPSSDEASASGTDSSLPRPKARTTNALSSASTVRPHTRRKRSDALRRRIGLGPRQSLGVVRLHDGAPPPQLCGETLEGLAALVDLAERGRVLGECKRTLDRCQVSGDLTYAHE